MTRPTRFAVRVPAAITLAATVIVGARSQLEASYTATAFFAASSHRKERPSRTALTARRHGSEA